MAVEIVEIDRHDDAVLEAYWKAAGEAELHERPYAVYWPLRTATVAIRGTDPTWKIIPLAAMDDGEVVGTCHVVLPQMDNHHLAYAQPTVRPAHRRRGIASALLAEVMDRCRAEGRTTIVVEAARPVGAESSPAWAFLAHHRFEPGIADVHRVLPLPVDSAWLEAHAQQAAPHHTDYTLVTCTDAIPDQYVDGFCALQEAFNDEAPSGELDLEPEVWTSERLRANEARRVQQGTWSQTTLAVARDGAVVGMSELIVSGEGKANCLQGGTLVLQPHRGHRLGMALKVANLQALQARDISAPMVHSSNAEENEHMAAINIELGFTPVEEVAELQRRL